MKRILMAVVMVFTFIIGACSCDKFDISTYESAVKNFKNSTGFEYELIVTKKVEGQNYYVREESYNKYSLTTTGEVENFSSLLKSYTIATPDNGPEGAPTLVYTEENYYNGEENKFYFNKVPARGMGEKGVKENITYEHVYNEANDPRNTKNLVPTFSKDELSGFQIANIESKKGYSSSVFTAPVPSFIESDEDVALYSVTMNKNFYFDTMEFYVVDGDTTTTYEYKFINYNSNVNVEFPADLANY